MRRLPNADGLGYFDFVPGDGHFGARNRLECLRIGDVAYDCRRSNLICGSRAEAAHERCRRRYREQDDAAAIRPDVKSLGEKRNSESIENGVKDSDLVTARRQAVDFESASGISFRSFPGAFD